MATMVAFKAGTCADCERPIAVGENFEWGRVRGSRIHVDCESSREAAMNEDLGIATIEETETRHWSKYQEAIFDFGINGEGSGICYGVAGCAKTTTIEEMCRRMPANLQIAYLVFNRKNAKEAQERMPMNVEARTFHSACNSAIRRRLGKVEITDRKVWMLLDEMVEAGEVESADAEIHGPNLVKLVGLAKNAGIDCLVPNNDAEWNLLVDHYAIEFDSEGEEDPDGLVNRCIGIAESLLQASNEQLDKIDFDDMLYLTEKLEIALPQYDVVVVDEAQDTNAIQRSILRKMVRKGGRLIAVGDTRQAIYGFRGADADAMDRIKSDFKAIRLPLSVNYRCSKAVIRQAQSFCPEIEAWDGAPEGTVEHVTEMRLNEFLASDAILCRNTAPLIETAYAMLARGVPCTVLGRDIGRGLVALVRKMQGRRKQPITIDELLARLADYEARETRIANAKGDESKAQMITDKVDSVRAAINGLPETQRTMTGLIERIENLFTDSNTEPRTTLATVHKAKGLEWPRVFILAPEKMPSKWARRPWQIEQEQNLIYVAYTRAKVDLRFLPMDSLLTD